ncbi:Uncharacterised protein [uncultured archaeon]|nr:Uncharacterised protein [uncultured archaeon]
MVAESIIGREMHEERLSGKERIIHGAVGAGSLALDFVGIGEVEKGVILVGKGVGLMEKIGAYMTKKGAIKSATIFYKTARFMSEHPEITQEAETIAETNLKSFIKNMQNYKKGIRK